jgi:radical SAM superfamily enzyme YgiQ (UPF0313 family)
MQDLPPYRPPSEAHSILIRVVRGCYWNKCVFCGMYKGIKFTPRPLEEIINDIKWVRKNLPKKRTLFLGDSDSLVHKDIGHVIKEIKKELPYVERITSYSRISTLSRKSVKELKELKKLGLSRLHVGLESGNEEILEEMKKGVKINSIVDGGLKVKESGIELCFYVLCGLGGDKRWSFHAIETANIINKVQPQFVRLRTLVVLPNAPLYKKWEKGTFIPITPLNRLKELKLLLSLIEEFDGQIASDHITNYLWGESGIIFEGIEGNLRKEKNKMLEIVEKKIKEVEKREKIIDANTLLLRGWLQNL